MERDAFEYMEQQAQLADLEAAVTRAYIASRFDTTSEDWALICCHLGLDFDALKRRLEIAA